MKVFDLKADLEASHLTSGQKTSTKGYHSIGVGQAEYLIKTPAEYGGIPDGFGDFYIANGNVAELQYQGRINLKTYGAKGDGTTDDTLAITAALASGANLFVPSGTYMISKIVFSNQIEIYAEKGAFWKQISNTAATASEGAFEVSVSNVYINGLGFDGNQANQTTQRDLILVSSGVAYTYIYNIKINNCVMNGAAGSVCRCYSVDGFEFTNNHVENNHNILFANRNGVSTDLNSRNIRVSNNTFIGPDDISFAPDNVPILINDTIGGEIVNNYITGFASEYINCISSLGIEQSDRTKITAQMVIANNVLIDRNATSNSSGIHIGVNTEDFTVTNNVIEGFTAATGTLNSGIYFNGLSRNHTVCNNSIANMGLAGIHMSAALGGATVRTTALDYGGHVISGNTITDCDIGIMLLGDTLAPVYNVNIVNNILTDIVSTGIKVGDTTATFCYKTVVMGNQIKQDAVQVVDGLYLRAIPTTTTIVIKDNDLTGALNPVTKSSMTDYVIVASGNIGDTAHALAISSNPFTVAAGGQDLLNLTSAQSLFEYYITIAIDDTSGTTGYVTPAIGANGTGIKRYGVKELGGVSGCSGTAYLYRLV